MSTFVLVGLGNPDKEYQNNRHNIGFMAVDEIARRFGSGSWDKKYKGLYQKIQIQKHNVHLLKPQTFMNRSGLCVAQLVQFFKIPLDNIIVFHDDLDLLPWVIKLKKGGSAGGHNGLKSIDASIGKDYHRIRIGIGRPLHKHDVTPWVLGDFFKEDTPHIDNLCSDLSVQISELFDGNIEPFKAFIAKRKI